MRDLTEEESSQLRDLQGGRRSFSLHELERLNLLSTHGLLGHSLGTTSNKWPEQLTAGSSWVPEVRGGKAGLNMGYYVLCDPKPAEPSSIKIEMRIADLFKNGHGEAWTDDLCHLEMRVQQSYYFFESMVNEAQKKRDELMDDGKTMTNAFMKKERKLFLAGYDADSKVQIAMGLPGLKARFDAATATITKQDIFEHSMKVQYLLMLPSVMLLMLPTDATH